MEVGRSQKADHPSAIFFLYSVYMREVVLGPSVRIFLAVSQKGPKLHVCCSRPPCCFHYPLQPRQKFLHVNQTKSCFAFQDLPSASFFLTACKQPLSLCFKCHLPKQWKRRKHGERVRYVFRIKTIVNRTDSRFRRRMTLDQNRLEQNRIEQNKMAYAYNQSKEHFRNRIEQNEKNCNFNLFCSKTLFFDAMTGFF